MSKDEERVPQNLECGRNANSSPDAVMFQNFKHQIVCITMGARRRHGQKYRSEFTKTRHFKRQCHFFWTGGTALSQPPPRWEGISFPRPTPRPQPIYPNLPFRPPEFQPFTSVYCRRTKRDRPVRTLYSMVPSYYTLWCIHIRELNRLQSHP